MDQWLFTNDVSLHTCLFCGLLPPEAKSTGLPLYDFIKLGAPTSLKLKPNPIALN